jgi:hypothetical protein
LGIGKSRRRRTASPSKRLRDGERTADWAPAERGLSLLTPQERRIVAGKAATNSSLASRGRRI